MLNQIIEPVQVNSRHWLQSFPPQGKQDLALGFRNLPDSKQTAPNNGPLNLLHLPSPTQKDRKPKIFPNRVFVVYDVEMGSRPGNPRQQLQALGPDGGHVSRVVFAKPRVMSSMKMIKRARTMTMTRIAVEVQALVMTQSRARRVRNPLYP